MSKPNIERHFQVATNQKRRAGSLTLGSFDEDRTGQQHELKKLRVYNLRPYTDEKYQANLTVPGGVTIGPIDIPLTYNIETPVHIEVTNVNGPSSPQDIVATIADLPDTPNLYGATYLVQPSANADVAIPDAVVAVTGYTAGTLTFKDSSGTTICTASGSNQLVARPRLAKTVATSATGSAILMHY